MLPELNEIPLETDFDLRAPHEHMERIAWKYERDFKFFQTHRYRELYENNKAEPGRAAKIIDDVLSRLRNQIVALHGLGHPIAAVRDRLQEKITWERWRDTHHPRGQGLPVTLTYRHNQEYAIALLTLPEEDLEYFIWTRLFENTKDKDRVYVLDVLLSAFRKNYKIAKKYTRDKFAHVWADPLHKALTHPTDDKEVALEKLMDGWRDRLARFVPLDWKPWEEEQYKYITDEGNKIYALPNFDFAYEVALAVCAYDMDDSNFRDHPYYPRDLVDFYRANIRQTRDAWRAPEQGPTVDLEPYEVKRIDLAKKKNKGFRRWLDIASNGDPDAAGEVFLRFPKLRKIKNLSEVVNVMGDYGIALLVDLKDAETCESELLRLIKEREIATPYTLPETEFAAGPGRCQELLAHCGEWFAQNGYRMIHLLSDGDWDAIVIDQVWEEEFNDLSQKLGLKL